MTSWVKLKECFPPKYLDVLFFVKHKKQDVDCSSFIISGFVTEQEEIFFHGLSYDEDIHKASYWTLFPVIPDD